MSDGWKREDGIQVLGHGMNGPTIKFRKTDRPTVTISPSMWGFSDEDKEFVDKVEQFLQSMEEK